MPYNSYYQSPYQQQAVYPQYVQQVPQVPQYQQIPQITAQPTQSVQQVTTSGMMWVNDEREASMYPVAPNTAIALWDSKVPVVYVKQTDASGKPGMKIYDLVERVEDNSDVSRKSEAVNTFATKDELAVVVGAVKDVNGVLASLRGDIDALKGDMYGIAGKKKPVKRTAEDSEDE